MFKDFDGKAVIVTGGGSGIGEACVLELAERGAKVVVADINLEHAGAVVDRVKASGGEAAAVKVNVGDAAEVKAMVEFAVSTYGRLDGAVNNAGIGGPAKPIAEYEIDEWKRVIEVNLNGVFYGVKYQIEAMLRNGGGSIVNMASVLGSVGIANSSAYVTTKHALIGMTKNAALEYSAKGIRVNAVGPGFIATPLLDSNLDQETKDALAAQHATGRLGTPEEVSAITCFLLSDRASFVTGSYQLVDGGYAAH
ncbi:SDR family NAD(P)-dependent oxidoreductase [Rhizobium halophytocola]|uniref:NAD(P)-dependent dehydrogenase (Short-subunit alcohol dehydrogenase family) n=1 Tax=Rhizobium halophytocola TaxID=735519 RepID=A0ABS4E095_9HYPH|nr:SDR family NAD(P)-dependent oxidoreductase [Rhizobium halophytocola]MBP1851353.1 NAD(P)-dependent dehydrogenase (short-subunit alcohol dehydrogenase family) [Rhizobium halophytocola]